MELVQIKIKKDSRWISYVKRIREYENVNFGNSTAIGELKKRMEENAFVITFDLSGREHLHIKGMTEFEWHSRFYRLLNELIDSGAELELYYDGRPDSMTLLNNRIHTRKEISEECDRYPD